MKSLDPRINRIQPDIKSDPVKKEGLDQLETYEVFVQSKESRPYQHEGIVHASDEEMAFVFAKEQFSRRSTCTGIMIVNTSNVFVSGLSEGETSIYQSVEPVENPTDSAGHTYLVFHLLKRGKQHKLAGEVRAKTPEDALFRAKESLDPGKPVYNVWAIREEDILTVSGEDKVIWETLPEKTFREAMDYRGADKIKKFKEGQDQK